MPSLKGIGASIKRMFGFGKSKAEKAHKVNANTIAKDQSKPKHLHTFDEVRAMVQKYRNEKMRRDACRAYRKRKKALGDKTRKMNFAKAKNKGCRVINVTDGVWLQNKSGHIKRVA